MKKKHILLIPSSFPGRFTKYSGVFYKEQSTALSLLDATIGVVCPEIVSMRDPKLLFKLHLFGKEYVENLENVQVFRKIGFNVFPFFRKFEKNLFCTYSEKLVDKYIKLNGKPDLIHCHSALWSGEAARLIKKKYDIPYVITEHSSYVMLGKYSDEREALLKKIYQESVKLIAVSKKLGKAVECLGNNEVEIIPNVVDTSQFSKSANRCAEKLININTLSKNKRVDDLIRSFAIVKNSINNAELHIVGDGPEMNNLQSLAGNLNVNESVIFHGAIPHAEINALIEGKGILISTSEYETFGVTLIEAMAKGIPVVATKCGGPEDFVNNQNGILVDVGNIEAISDAITIIVNNYESFLPDKIANFVEVNFGRHSIAKKLENIYTPIINS